MKYQRHIDMLQYIINKGNVSIEELLSHFHVSKATLNRDINELVKSGNVSKVHGGVVSTVNSGEFEQVIEDKERLNISFKTKIAETAYSMLEDNDTIIIDSGSTMYYFAKLLAEDRKLKNLTVATNDLKVAYTLCGNRGISLVVSGGIKHRDAYDLYGGMSDIIETLNVKKYFMGASAFDIAAGVTHTNYEDVLLKKRYMSYASECILCADSTKESQVKRFKLCEPEALSILITDSGLSEEKIMEYREKGIKVILCD